MQTEREQITRK